VNDHLSQADQIAQEALQAYEQANFDQAINLFEQARAAYNAAGDLIKAAEMANNLSVALVQVKSYQAALDVLQGTTEVFSNHGDIKRAAQSIGNKAAAYEGMGDWEKAEANYLAAADQFGHIGDQDNQHYTLQGLSRVRLRQGRAIEAVSTMQGALETGAKSNWRTRLVQKLLSIPARLLKP
jgi:tetratricopeptide (TPR) repeat protein